MANNKSTVYMHVNKIDGKKYIGYTTLKPEERWKKGNGYKSQSFGDVINECGWDNFEHIIIATDLSIEEAKALEIKLIAEYDTIDPNKGYNMTKGGDGAHGVTQSEESNAKRREALLGEKNHFYGKRHTEETKELISKVVKEYYATHKHPFTGRHHTQETKDKLSESRKGKYCGDENGFYGRTHSNESKKKMSDSHKKYYETHDVWNKGKPMSEETKQKLIASRKGKNARGKHPNARQIVQLDLDGNFIAKFDCIQDACEKYGFHNGGISRVCYGERKTYKGYKWMYYEDYIKLIGGGQIGKQ